MQRNADAAGEGRRENSEHLDDLASYFTGDRKAYDGAGEADGRLWRRYFPGLAEVTDTMAGAIYPTGQAGMFRGLLTPHCVDQALRWSHQHAPTIATCTPPHN